MRSNEIPHKYSLKIFKYLICYGVVIGKKSDLFLQFLLNIGIKTQIQVVDITFS